MPTHRLGGLNAIHVTSLSGYGNEGEEHGILQFPSTVASSLRGGSDDLS